MKFKYFLLMTLVLISCSGCFNTSKLAGIPNPSFMIESDNTAVLNVAEIEKDLTRKKLPGTGVFATYEVMPLTKPYLKASLAEEGYKKHLTPDQIDTSIQAQYKKYCNNTLSFKFNVSSVFIYDAVNVDYIKAEVIDYLGNRHPLSFFDVNQAYKSNQRQVSTSPGNMINGIYFPGHSSAYTTTTYYRTFYAKTNVDIPLDQPFSVVVDARIGKNSKPFTLTWNKEK